MAGEAERYDMTPDPEEGLGRSRRLRRRAGQTAAAEDAERSPDPKLEDAVMRYIEELPIEEQTRQVADLHVRLYDKASELVVESAPGASEMVRTISQRSNWLDSELLSRN